MPYRDPEQRRAYGREWMKRNPEKARASLQRWRAAHPEEHRAQGRARYARHRERLKVRIAAYHAANPDIVRAKREKHRALRKGAEGSFTAEEWQNLVLEYTTRAATAGRSVRSSKTIGSRWPGAARTGSTTSCRHAASATRANT
jgi:hypothetical protein